MKKDIQLKDIQLLVVPDIHGRDFWKDAVYAHPDKEVIFLGDYIDPHAQEQITDKTALSILDELISLKKARPTEVHLLLGNHDLAYIDKRLLCSRHRFLDEYEIGLHYKKSIECFDIAYDKFIGRKKFLFSHAGMTSGWIMMHMDLFKDMPICGDLLTIMFRRDEYKDHIIPALADVSMLRGGEDRFGSPVWAGLLEMMEPLMWLPDIIQVFGHSQQEREPACIKEKAYCLDCRKVFYIDSKGAVRDYETDRILGDDRYIFLDIDGVMAPEKTGYALDPDCQSRLGEILQKTDAKIVLTSPWKGETIRVTEKFLTDTWDPHVGDYPFPYTDRIVALTHDWKKLDDDHIRGREIDYFLKMHSCKSYVILDTLDEVLDYQKPYYIKTQESVGLSDEDTKKAIDILLS